GAASWATEREVAVAQAARATRRAEKSLRVVPSVHVPPSFLHDQGSANTITVLPRLKSSWVLPPAATATYCLPPTMYETAGALTPAPHWYSQSFLPVFASKARKRPLPSPLKTRSPAVASTPPISGCSVSNFHATLPVSRLTADRRPHCFSLGITLNAPPSQSLPPGYAACSTWYVIGWCRLAA